jgi:hypothetical protein
MSDVRECLARHTAYQPEGKTWRCPKCASPDFLIETSADDANEECGLLHCEDEVSCHCGYGASGDEAARELSKIDNVKPCAHCNGTGVVSARSVRAPGSQR